MITAPILVEFIDTKNFRRDGGKFYSWGDQTGTMGLRTWKSTWGWLQFDSCVAWNRPKTGSSGRQNRRRTASLASWGSSHLWQLKLNRLSILRAFGRYQFNITEFLAGPFRQKSLNKLHDMTPLTINWLNWGFMDHRPTFNPQNPTSNLRHWITVYTGLNS